jgi:serralysin
MLRFYAFVTALLFTWTAISAPAYATFHLWKIQEVYSNADGSVQFIELISPNPSSNEHFVSGHPIRSNSRTFNLPNNLPSAATSGRTFLVATPGFAQLPGAVTPDFTFPSANFFSTVADNLRFDTVDSFVFTAGQLPTDGAMSRVDTTPFAATPTFVNVPNSPKNFAGTTGSLSFSIPGDLDGDTDVDRADAAILSANFGRPTLATAAQGDLNADGSVGLQDLAMLQARLTIAGASPAAVPEPSAMLLAGCGIVLGIYWRRRG